MNRVRTPEFLLLCVGMTLLFQSCPPLKVPNLVGLQQDIAQVLAEALGMTVGEVEVVFSDTVPVGEVMGQEPAPGGPIAPGTAVDLVVSAGPLILPEAAFAPSPVLGIAPWPVQFEDRSEPGSGEILSRRWDFGDSNSSTELAPLHVFKAPGAFTVTLTITTEYGSATTSAEVRIQAVEMVSVPAGTFPMGDPWSEGEDDELPVHEVTMSAYEIGKYEVTNFEYAAMLNWANQQGYLAAASTERVAAYDDDELIALWDANCQISIVDGQFVSETRQGFSMADHPVVALGWIGCAAYCNWLSELHGLEPCYDTVTWDCDFTKNGYHLPTEAQWERAAAWDGTTYFRYPVSANEISEGIANYGNANPLGLSEEPLTVPVGFYVDIASPVGCMNMAGNLRERCNDWFEEDYYSRSPSVDPLGPVGSFETHTKVTRGGGWIYIEEVERCANRKDHSHLAAFNRLGFRIARQAIK